MVIQNIQNLTTTTKYSHFSIGLTLTVGRCSLCTLMASKLSLTHISVLQNSIKTFPKHAQAIRLLPLLPLNSPSSQYFFKTKAQSTQSFSVSNAVIDQFVESSTSESTQDSQTIPSVPSSSSSPSSSKVVLVVGGTGGVGIAALPSLIVT